MSDKKEARAPRKPWSRKKKLWLLGGLPVGLIALPAAAAVLFAALAPISGSGQTGDFTASFTGTATVDASTMTVQPSGNATVTSGALKLPSVQMFPGERFTVAAQVTVPSGKYGYVTGIQMPGLPSGYVVKLNGGCGNKVTSSMPANVSFIVTAPATQTPGVSWTLDKSAGVMVTPLNSADATVPQATCDPYTAP